MGFRGAWAPDLCVPYRVTSRERVSGKLDFHWFSVDQWGFEVNGPQIRIPHIKFLTVVSKVANTGLLSGDVLLTRLQTDRQTFFRKTLLSVEGKRS
jgi:hypothetical protein